MGISIEYRFWSKVQKSEDGCWLWTASRNSGGYGNFGVGDRVVGAHRFSYQLANGPIPKGLFVLHRCDTPACVNPNHLWLGTQKENMVDRDMKGRHNPVYADRHGARVHPESIPQGSARFNSKLNEVFVLRIRERYAAGNISQHKLAVEYGVHSSVVGDIVHGKSWAHVGGPIKGEMA